MPSLKMKTKSTTDCLREKNGLRVCQKSNMISKDCCSRVRISRQAAEFEACVQNCQEVHTQDNGDDAIDCTELLDGENFQFQKQLSPLVDSETMEGMGSTVVSGQSNLETIFSPIVESIEVHGESNVDIDAGNNEENEVPLLQADDSDDGSRTSCNVSDFYISDMTILPMTRDSVYGNITESNAFSNYRCDEPSILFDMTEDCMILPLLEDTIETSNSHDGRTCEEAIDSEDSSLYMAIHQIRTCNEESDVSPHPDLDQSESFDPQMFIRNLPDVPDVETDFRPNILPKERTKHITLVLDLDETLVHSTLEHSDDADFSFPVLFNMKEHIVYVKQRPYLRTFLERVAEMFEIVVFTASQSIYAEQLLDILDPDGKLISRRAYRESCIFSDGNYTKDLTILGVDLAKIVIIDNSPQVFQLQVNNGIPIKSWFDDPSDSALILLLPFLETLADADDVRPIIAKRFGSVQICRGLAANSNNNSMSETFTLVMHYGGKFIRRPCIMYKGGNVKYFEKCDPDLMSYFELQDMFIEVGHQPTSNLFFGIPRVSLDNGLRKIEKDDDVIDMLEIHIGHPLIVIYVEDGSQQVSEEYSDNETSEDDNVAEDDDDSSDPEWLNEGLEGNDDDDIFGLDEETIEGNGVESTHVMEDVEDWLSDVENEADLLSQLGSSDDEERRISYPEFNENHDMEKPELKVGLRFTNAQVFREALREWCVQHGYDIKYIRNENARITAVCKNECGWRIHASPIQDEKTYQIKSLNPVHHCGRSYNNHLVTSQYLSTKYLQKLRDDPTWKVEAMQKYVKRHIMVDVTRRQVYRAKSKAKKIIDGDHNKQCAKLWDYAETLRRFNPNSCIKIMVERPTLDVLPTFERMYVRFGAQEDGFLAGCRPIIGLDGCHLKGVHKGQLLAAIGRDGNDNMYPISIAVVEAETKNSWTWFLTELLNDIVRVEDKGWTFISDRQKGLVETFQELLPSADHRYCLRHMYSNFKQKFKGKELKNCMWKAAFAGTVREFEFHMKKIQSLDPEKQEAYNWSNQWSFEPEFKSRIEYLKKIN